MSDHTLLVLTRLLVIAAELAVYAHHVRTARRVLDAHGPDGLDAMTSYLRACPKPVTLVAAAVTLSALLLG